MFRFWVTADRAILNMNPREAVHFYRDDFEIIGEELAHHRS
jgi:hypothetical protein